MALSQSQKKPDIALVSVGSFTEGYPNTTIKAGLLQKHYGDRLTSIIYNSASSDKNTRLSSVKVYFLLKFILNNIRAWLKILVEKPRIVYICYPGVFLSFLLSITPKRYRPKIAIDAFISLYDTIVVDRKLFDATTFQAKLIFSVEQKAYEACNKIIVDTSSNIEYNSQLFQISPEHFQSINLTIPEITSTFHPKQNKHTTCLFIGTLVPLQGVEYIAKAAALLSDREDIRFRIIGNGQDGEYLEEIIRSEKIKNISWEKDWQSTNDIQVALNNADICLGIFGTTQKTQRVWPFKNYLYMAAGKPIITSNTTYAQELLKQCTGEPFITCPTGNPKALAKVIRNLADTPTAQKNLGDNASEFYNKHLNHNAALKQLTSVLDALNKG